MTEWHSLINVNFSFHEVFCALITSQPATRMPLINRYASNETRGLLDRVRTLRGWRFGPVVRNGSDILTSPERK
jgi:hypothetical protein